MRRLAPVLDSRSEEAIAVEIAAAAPAHAPGWQPGAAGAGAAVVRVFARYLRTLADRINAAPDKNRLAFFEQLGIELTPAQAARAPVVFRPLPNVGDSRIPARTRLGAQSAHGDAPLVYETESAVALAGAPLAEVVTLLPGRDAYADHSAAALAGEAFTLFEPLRPVPHELYLGHAAVLALAGECTLELDLELETAASKPLEVAWELWDGETWRAFKRFEPAASATAMDSLDGTAGLTHSGTIRLVAECAVSKAHDVASIRSFWVRGRLLGPLPPDGPRPPLLRRVALRSTIDRALPAIACASLGEATGLLPEEGLGGATKLDFTKAVQPLGAHPKAGDTFHIALEEAFSRPGAEVTLCFAKVDTADEVIDQLGAEYEEDANNAQRVTLQAAIHAARALLNAGRGVLSIIRRDPLPAPPAPLPPVYQQLSDAADALATEIGVAQAELANAIANDRGVDLEATLDPLVEPARVLAYWIYRVNTLATASQPASPTPAEPEPPEPIPPQPGVERRRHAGLENPRPFDTGFLPGPIGWPWPWGTTRFVDATANDLEDAANTDPTRFAERLALFIQNNETRVRQAGTFGRDAASAANASLEQLDTLTPIDAVRAAGVRPPPMPEPVVAWEYWNGRRWRTLIVAGSAEARTFRDDGPITFTVPPDIDTTEVNGIAKHWVRARLLSGGYGTVRLVSWRDERTQRLNFFPIVQVRPPSLEKMRLGYRFRSGWTVPEHCLTHNDFRYTNRTTHLRERLAPFRPFEPVEDRTPALYLGFDGALPADRVGLWLGIEEVLGVESGPPLVWEAWTGAGWQAVAAEDGTRHLALPGVVAVLWPGVEVAAARFPRFRRPRTWLRARLAIDGPPRRSRVDSVLPNAVWAAHAETLENERLGSGTGEPDLVLFARARPVLEGEVLEVRELEGGRAAVEEAILRGELAAAGVAPDDVRVTTDPRTERVDAVWVRWRRRASLLFSETGAREFAIEHSRGRVLFGDGERGRIPPPGRDNIRFRVYRTGGGTNGNVAGGAIDQVLAGVLVREVTNPRPAQGGADIEPLDRLRERAPAVIRSRSQAITAEDYEALALQASPAVAVARALPHTHPSGRHAPGWVTVRIVPQSSEPRPEPSFEVRQRVRRFLAARAPAAIAGQVAVLPPLYLPVGVQCTLRPVHLERGGEIRDRALAALAAFLHPLTGGPERRGWRFGRDVYLSDVAALLESIPGVDYASSLALERDGTPAGDRVSVPGDRLVVAGPLRIRLTRLEE